MPLASVLRLILLASIWGGSFLFMRLTANSLGPAVLIEGRVLAAALCLLLISLFLRRQLRFTSHIKHYFIIGAFNTALPFLMFAYAAQTLNASTLAILNSTAPLFAALIASLWQKERLKVKAGLGLFIGMVGVTVLVGQQALALGEQGIWAIIACLFAAAMYGFSANYTKVAPAVAPFENAHGSMWAAVIVVLPLLPFMPIRDPITVPISLSVLTLGIVCTGFAYLLYFKLVKDDGPASALSVTFLVPLFGILWGRLFLGEEIGINTLLGALLVITGTILVTGFSFKRLLAKGG
ncbi:membrane protein [Psychromonas marina]|uniref:Membrane protein n=1 Tax=Psychromonas marina TaxID=88364 RepID=A0ABQ6E3X0_9GAMM|nr:DMT family transporter [Psychromonas marina]GLS92084.1 membrane protein [Psychromonas marina]